MVSIFHQRRLWAIFTTANTMTSPLCIISTKATTSATKNVPPNRNPNRAWGLARRKGTHRSKLSFDATMEHVTQFSETTFKISHHTAPPHQHTPAQTSTHHHAPAQTHRLGEHFRTHEYMRNRMPMNTNTQTHMHTHAHTCTQTQKHAHTWKNACTTQEHTGTHTRKLRLLLAQGVTEGNLGSNVVTSTTRPRQEMGTV